MTCPFRNRFIYVTMMIALQGCASGPPARLSAGAPVVEVPAVGETVPVASANVDAADDPAIWAAPAGRRARLNGTETSAFIAGTDKKAGLYIYGLDGKQLQFLPDGLLNNVDLRSDIMVDGRSQVVLGASDRGRMGVAMYIFDPAATTPTNAVRPWGFVKSDVTEPYGFCLGRIGEELHALLIGKDGQARQYRIDASSAGARGVEVRRFAVGSQSEGCVIDDRAGILYIGEELKGVWRYGASPADNDARTLVQAVDSSARLVADVEGATLMRDGSRTYLLISSQGDSAFAVWRVDGQAPVYSGRFRVAARLGSEAVSGTDGIDALGGPVGPFPEGLVVVQDDENDGQPQNFKLLDWRDIRKALNLF